jgi:hypothetical protein
MNPATLIEKAMKEGRSALTEAVSIAAIIELGFFAVMKPVQRSQKP